jgi:hypothetical protein
VLYVRAGGVSMGWCTLYHNIPASENVVIEWLYPDGSVIQFPVTYQGDERYDRMHIVAYSITGR